MCCHSVGFFCARSQAAAIAILHHPLSPNFQFPDPPIPMASRFVLHPRASFDAAIVATVPVNAVQIDMATKNEGFRIYLYGAVSYRDALDERRETTFCLAVVPSENLLAISHGPPLQL